jgi:membrane protein implicated in regulation of membrane protease activity
MDIQEFLAFVALGVALVFLYHKFFKPKSKKKGCNSNDCGC